MEPLFSKVFKCGRLAFKADVFGLENINLCRLPVVTAEQKEGESFDYDQVLCMMHKKYALDYEGFDSVADMIDMYEQNAGFNTENYQVCEYVGREGSSSNFYPDTAMDGFLDQEIETVMKIVEQDEEFTNKIKELYAKQVVEKMIADK